MVDPARSRAEVTRGTATWNASGVTGIRDGRREFGQQVEVRCWDSVDARIATPSRLSIDLLRQVADEIVRDVPGVVSVTYNITPKPPSTIEAV